MGSWDGVFKRRLLLFASWQFCLQLVFAAEMPPVQRIVVFGDLHLEKAVRELLPTTPIRLSDAEWEALHKKLTSSAHWKRSDMSWVCCEPGGTAILYVGVSARGEGPSFRPPPAGAERLDADDVALYDRLMEANYEAVTSAGIAAASSRNLQDRAIERGRKLSPHWRAAAANSADKHHRAAATHLSAYTKKDQALADLLVSAAGDGDALVRNNAVRALGSLAMSKQDRVRLRIDPVPLLKLFESVSWTDWNKTSFALMPLTEGDSRLLSDVVEHAGEALRQIAEWPSMHSTPARVILRRAAAAPRLPVR